MNIKTCCFFGHRHLYDSESSIYKLLINTIEPLIIDSGFTEFLFGGYGAFDALAHRAADELKKSHADIKTVYVQAYYKPHDANMESIQRRYDEVHYPELEEKPPRFAITYRNRAMIDSSEFCIFYVRRDHGGAFDAMQYAKRKGKAMINLADLITK